MSSIKVLSVQVSNQIAAGEVIERPASIIKELVENSIDAGATSIAIEMRNGGIDYLRVADNGCGIAPEDVVIAFKRHATSKISVSDDLEHIETLGFRGEALASIAAVSRISLTTREKSSDTGVTVKMDAGELKYNSPCGCPDGTTIEVNDVFYNVPARLKFLKSPRAEAGYISDYVSRMIMARPDIAFRLINNDKTIYTSSGDGNLKNAIFSVYGKDVIQFLKPVEYDDGYVKISGFAGMPEISKSNRTYQSLFINGRYIKSQTISLAVQRAYETHLMIGKFPLYVLNIKISSNEIDVNVHPNKLDVRFKDEGKIVSSVSTAIRALFGVSQISRIDSNIFNHRENAETESQNQVSTRYSEIDLKDDSEIAQIRNNFIGRLTEEHSVEEPTNKNLENVYAKAENDNITSSFTSSAAFNSVPVFDIKSSHEERIEEIKKIDTEVNVQQEMLGDIPYKIVGCLFNTYWIVEQGNKVFYIDQHAAHERRLYEKYISGELKSESQILLIPSIIKLAPQEFNVLMDNIDSFTELGYEIEEFGTNTICVRAVPLIMGEMQTDSFIHEAISCIEKIGFVNAKELKRASIIQSSCKHAIKGGDFLSDYEIKLLLKEIEGKNVPLTCPHGRPIILEMKKSDYEKMFKRIV